VIHLKFNDNFKKHINFKKTKTKTDKKKLIFSITRSAIHSTFLFFFFHSFYFYQATFFIYISQYSFNFISYQSFLLIIFLKKKHKNISTRSHKQGRSHTMAWGGLGPPKPKGSPKNKKQNLKKKK
jgi:hypothetical protein